MDYEYLHWQANEHHDRMRSGKRVDTRLLAGLANPDLMSLGTRLLSGRTKPAGPRERAARLCDLILTVRNQRRRGNYAAAAEYMRLADSVFDSLPRFVRLPAQK